MSHYFSRVHGLRPNNWAIPTLKVERGNLESLEGWRKDANEGAGQLTYGTVLQHNMCRKQPSALTILRLQATGRTP